nr:hypothetical protein [Acinetobacter baumannii]
MLNQISKRLNPVETRIKGLLSSIKSLIPLPLLTLQIRSTKYEVCRRVSKGKVSECSE